MAKDVNLTIKASDQATAPMRKVMAQMAQMQKVAANVGAKLSKTVTAPLLGIAAAGTAVFVGYEKGLSSMSTLIDTNKESLDAIGKSVMAIGRRTPVALEDLTAALYDVRSAGVGAGDQFRVLEGSARLAVAGMGSTKEAVDLVTSSINAFGLQGEEQARVYDIIFKTVKSGKTNISQLAQGFGAVAGTVASAGVELDEYFASVAALTTSGLPASQAHSQLGAVLSGLTRQGKLTSEVFRRLGAKDLKDLVEQSGGLVPALTRIREVLKDNNARTLEMVGSTEALNAIIGLTGASAGAYETALDGMRDGTDGVGEAFDKMNATSSMTLMRLKNQLTAAGIAIGRVLVPILQDLVPIVERAANWFEGLSDGQRKTVVALGAVAAATGPVLVGMAKMAQAVQYLTGTKIAGWAAGWVKYLWMMRASIYAGVVTPIGIAAKAVWAFTAALLANPITWVIAAIAALAGAAYLIYKYWDPIKAFFIDLWGTITDAVTSAWETIKPVLEMMWEIFKKLPIGRLVDGAIKLGRSFFSDGDSASAAAPLGAATAAPGRGGDAHVTVDFANMPKGTRVKADPKSTADLDLSLGYSMVTS